MNIQNKSLIFLGVPISNLSMQATVDRIFELIETYKIDLHPRYVATLNADFLTQTNNWNFNGVRFPELLHLLRQADIVTIDGMPILWGCRGMGSHVPERVTGADLLPKIAEACSQQNKSIFLLGGNEHTSKLCVLYLQALYPSLLIAGSAHPNIDIAGIELAEAETRDALLVEQINRSQADILLINLGNPKQEVWFGRIYPQLRVPVSLGIGGSFNLLTGIISRAPVWMQKTGLEWSYRLAQEPKRLWKRYFVDILKFTYMITPVLFFQSLSRLLYNMFYKPKSESLSLSHSLLFISANSTMALVTLPSRLNETVTNEINGNLDDLFSHDALIFDFKVVRHLDLEGIRLLLHISVRAAIKEKKQFFMINVPKDIKLMFKLHRIWDSVEQNICRHPQEILSRLIQQGSNTHFYDAIQQEQHYVVISIFGRLDIENNYEEYIKKIKPEIYQKECILDLRYCTYIDNTGFQFLLKLKELQKQHFISLKINGLSKSLKRQFAITKVSHLFNM